MAASVLQSLLDEEQLYIPEWPEPLLFSDIETPAISADFLPPVLRDFVIALAVATETPIEMALACALGTVSVALTGKVVVNPKPGWEEPVNTYWIVELLPANRKSKVFKSCTQPLILHEKAQQAILEPVIARALSKRKSQEKFIEKKRIEAVKVQDAQKREELFEEIAKLEDGLEKIPVLPRLFCNNVTPEALENFTYEQNGRFAVMSDEGGVMETLTGLYTSGRANIDLILKGIDGGEVRIGRKDRDITMNPFLTFVLCVQPKVREKMGKNPALQGNGALERFLYIVPRSTIGFRTHDTIPMPAEIQARYNETISRLLSLSLPRNPDGKEQPYILTLSPDAYADVKDFEKWLEPQLRPFGKLYSCQGWCGKLVGYALRIAGLMHVAEYGVDNRQISATTMRNALWIAHHLIQHTIAAYRLMGLDERISYAKHICDWFIHTGTKQISRSELTSAMRHHMKAEQLDKALKELSERNIIRAGMIEGKGSKPTTVYAVNPGLFQPTPTVTSETTESLNLPDLPNLPEGA